MVKVWLPQPLCHKSSVNVYIFVADGTGVRQVVSEIVFIYRTAEADRDMVSIQTVDNQMGILLQDN